MAARRPPEDRDERRLGELGDLADGGDPALAELVGGDHPDTPEPFHRQGVEEGELAVGRHHQQTVGLGHAAGHLGEELGPGDPDGDGQADPLADLAPQPHGDVGRRARDPSQPADVEERLVDRQPLDQRRRVVEHLEHRLARLGVGRHPGLDHHRLRAQPAGLHAAHRRADPARLGLVAGREHHPGPDDHRAAAQPRVVPLLDRRVERVHVGVQDGRLAHEHMFARNGQGKRIRGSALTEAVSR